MLLLQWWLQSLLRWFDDYSISDNIVTVQLHMILQLHGMRPCRKVHLGRFESILLYKLHWLAQLRRLLYGRWMVLGMTKNVSIPSKFDLLWKPWKATIYFRVQTIDLGRYRKYVAWTGLLEGGRLAIVSCHKCFSEFRITLATFHCRGSMMITFITAVRWLFNFSRLL